MTAHARLGPSNHRWPHCPGSVREEAAYPDTSSDAARDGTGSHLLLELCIDAQNSADHAKGQQIGPDHPEGPWTVDAERAARVQMCLDYIERRRQELTAQFPGCTVTVEAETKADPGGAFGRDDWWGTCDITIKVYGLEAVLFVETVDYKDGRGWVDAEDNSQLWSYLFGKMRPFIASGPHLVRPFHPGKLQGGRMTIVQPKTTPPVRYRDVTPGQVISAAEDLAVAAHRTDDPDAPLIPGDHCQWCKHKPNCAARKAATAEQATGGIQAMTNELSAGGDLLEVFQNAVADPKSLSDAQLSAILDTEAAIKQGYDAIRDEAMSRIESGAEVPGYTVAPGRSTRAWALTDDFDEKALEKKLKGMRFTADMLYPKKLLSPAQAEKAAHLTDRQKKNLQDLIVTIAGKDTLKAVSRKPKQTAEELFADTKPSPISFL